MKFIRRLVSLVSRETIKIEKDLNEVAEIQPELTLKSDLTASPSPQRPVTSAEITDLCATTQNVSSVAIVRSDIGSLITTPGTSLKKTEANRRNARSSTGPRTIRGKLLSSQNALKHGLYAEHIIVSKGDGKESVSEFRSLLSQLEQELRPVGCLERLEVEKIAKCVWRLKRIARAEAGQIQLKTGNARMDSLLADTVAVETSMLTPHIFPDKLLHSPMGNRALVTRLENIIAELGSDPNGLLSPVHVDQITRLLGNTGVVQEYLEVRNRLSEVLHQYKDMNNPEVLAEFRSLKHAKKPLLKILEAELSRRVGIVNLLAEKEEVDLDATIKSESIPDQPTNILRLERKVEKELARAHENLKKLQAGRMN